MNKLRVEVLEAQIDKIPPKLITKLQKATHYPMLTDVISNKVKNGKIVEPVKFVF